MHIFLSPEQETEDLFGVEGVALKLATCNDFDQCIITPKLKVLFCYAIYTLYN